MSNYRVVVTQEQLEVFHSIDRKLYDILTMNLNRDPFTSMHAVALLMWLERLGFDELVYKATLLTHPNINKLTNELLLCLNCIGYTQFPFSSPEHSDDLCWLRSIAETEISPGFFIVNRMAAQRGVTKVINDVCLRVFPYTPPVTSRTDAERNN